MTRLTARVLAALLLLAASLPLQAQVRAWLERDRIELGETVTLNVEASGNAAPDYAPLLADFDLSGHASRQQFEWTNGRMQARSLYGVSLRPRRAGLLAIPALRVGAGRTAPLSLLVTTPTAPRAPLARGRDVFIESEADDQDPYVQQSVGWTVRLYALPALVSGRLDQDAPTGASLQRIGDDVQYRRDVGGRTYQVIERRYLLIPERSGELAMPPARFQGRAVGGVFDRLFGDGQVDLRARAAPRVLTVRPIPASAPSPWLPLHAATMEYLERPGTVRAGEAATFVVQLLADGAGRAQMPALEVPAPAGAQVFAEAAQVDEAIVEGRPRVRVTRRFSVVPARPGPLRIEGPELAWWDVRAGRARVTRLPPLELDVAPGSTQSAPAAGAPVPPGIPRAASGGARLALPAGLAVATAIALLAWGLWRRRRARSPGPASAPGPSLPAGPSLAQALAMGDLADIEAALRARAPAGVLDLDQLRDALDDECQRAALTALGQARWAGGDPAQARGLLREAFAAGPRWVVPPAAPTPTLPPLYPEG